ncbi:MAG: hypothetical protein Q8K58_00235 [Acidimicrobiales bacterium]|nr:hypothetical protein [Acidimicrobiales bacterium]
MDVEDPALGTVRMPGPPYRLSALAVANRGSPGLGQHDADPDLRSRAAPLPARDRAAYALGCRRAQGGLS